MNILARKLKHLMDIEGVSQIEVGEKLEWAQSYISNMLNGKKVLDDEKAERILVKAFDYKPSEARRLVSQWRVEEYLQNLPELAERLNMRPLDRVKDFINVPFMGTLSSGALKELDLVGPEGFDSPESVPVIAELLPGDPSLYFAFRANGDSMSPEIPSGAIVVVKHLSELVNQNKIYVFRFHDEFGLGRIVRSGSNYSISKSNKSYPDIPINSEDFGICGYVEAITIGNI